MQTLKLKISNISNIDYVNNKVNNYNYAFHFLYKKLEEINDPNLVNYIMRRFDLNDIEYRSLLSDVKSFFLRDEKGKQKKLKRLETIKEKLTELESKSKTKKTVRTIFKLNKKLTYLTKSIDNNVVFGGRIVLQEITRLYNKKLNNTFISDDELKLDVKLSKYKKQRKLPLFILGESNRKGNRFININDLLSNIITYKPNKSSKIKIEIANYKNYKKIFKKLIELSNLKDISISVRLSNNYIYLTFDEEKLNGYNINEKERLIEVKEIKNQHHNKEYEKQLIKELYKKYYRGQECRKLEGKKSNRYLGIDLNPNFIGYSIVDKINNGIDIIHTGSYSLKELSKRLNVKSESPEQLKLNKKRKHELYQVLKNLVNLCLHYGVAYICIEELGFKIDEISEMSKEANRQTKNLWYRTIITNNLNKKCNENGIQIIEVNPILSSYIGNIMYNYVDCINASIEIARRGIYKYIKNRFYPLITDTILNTVEAGNNGKVKKSEDVLEIKGSKMTWIELYHSSQFRWRKTLKESKFDFERLRLFAYGSGIKVIKNYNKIHYK